MGERTATFRLPVEREVHTSDLTGCSRANMHRLRGEVDAWMTEALFRGLWAGASLEHLHRSGLWSDPAEAVERGKVQSLQQSKDENRPLTDAVARKVEEIGEQVCKCVTHYAERLADWFSQCKLIGVELPVRLVMDDGDYEPITFASHIDLLFRDPDGHLCLWDWKHQDQAPTMDYLGRNLQFALYHLCIVDGLVRVDADLDIWHSYAPERPRLGWVDLARFKPYSRKTTTTLMDGTEHTYVKGDERPRQNIIREWHESDDRELDMRRALVEHVLLMRAGFWPMTPDKLGCHLCESKHWCVSGGFHKDNPQ